MIIALTGKADDRETVCLVKEALDGEMKATGKSKRGTKSDDPPQYRHWLMKSEPESRLENGIDVKVRGSAAQTVKTVGGWHSIHGSASFLSSGSRT